jgi:dTDP-4-dehydrorhamnose 3,5-epimerase-like enzyme
MSVEEYFSVSRISTDRDPVALEKEGRGYFAWKEDALAALFHNGDPMTFMAYLEFKNGVTRGNHYHLKQRQWMLIVAGELQAKLLLPDSPEHITTLTLKQGDLLYCAPGCVHSYRAQDSAAAVEYSPERYEVDDMVNFPVEW